MKTQQEIENQLRQRIKELNEADAEFCKKRWDMNEPEYIRKLMREQSNSVTLARQELEAVIEFMGLPRFLTGQELQLTT